MEDTTTARFRHLLPVAAVLVATGAGACATTGGMLETRGEGVTRFYETSFDTLWTAARHAIRANGLQTDDESEYDGYIVATNPPDRQSDFDDERVAVEADQGERIAVFLDSVGPRAWSVEVVTRRRFSLDPGKTPWAEDIFWVIERDLAEGARIQRESLPDSVLEEAPRPEPGDGTPPDSAGGSTPPSPRPEPGVTLP